MRKSAAALVILALLMPLLIMPVELVSAASSDSWITKASMHEARGGLGVAVVNGKIYAIGGSTRAGSPDQYTGGFVGTNEEYDPETDTWTFKRPMPTSRAYFRVEVVNDKIYCIGGLTTDNAVPTCAFEVYDPSTDTWKRLASCPTFREDFTTAVYKDRIYVIGGIVNRDLQAGSRGTYTGITEVYDTTLDRWQIKAPMPNSRYPETCDVINGKIYVISGSTTYYESVSITVVYDEATNTWTKMASMPFVKHGSSAVLNGKIYFVGGSYEGEDYVSRLQIFDPETDTWTEGSRPPKAVTVPDFAVAVKGEASPRRIYVLGGGLNIYDPENDTWTFGGELPTSRAYIGFAALNERICAIGGQTITYPSDLLSRPYPTITTHASNEVYTPDGYGTPDPAYLLETTPPKIEVLSPLDQTYYGPSVPLAFSLDKQVGWIGYSIDGNQNTTVTGNCTLVNMTNGLHKVTVYANDTFGNQGASETIAFQMAEPFPILPLFIAIVAGVVLAGVGFMHYWKSRRGRRFMDNKAIAVTLAFVFLVAMTSAVAETRKAQANPIINVYRDISPPEGAQPPIITILTPQNNSFYPKNVTLAFNVTAPRMSGDQALDGITKIYFEASWETEETIVAENKIGSFSVDLSNVRGGNHSVTVHAVGVGYIETGTEYREENGVIVSYNYYDRFHMTSYSTVSFIKDLVPPMLSVLSPQNTTYQSTEVKLDFTVNERVSQILYSLDGRGNRTVAGNTTLTGLTNGEHNLVLYVVDLARNIGSSRTLCFNVNSSEPFPSVPVAVVIFSVSLCAGFLIFFRKRVSGKIQ